MREPRRFSHPFLVFTYRRLLPIAKEAQDVEEEVDEVQIKGKATHQCQFVCLVTETGMLCLLKHNLDLLCVIGSLFRYI